MYSSDYRLELGGELVDGGAADRLGVGEALGKSAVLGLATSFKGDDVTTDNAPLSA